MPFGIKSVAQRPRLAQATAFFPLPPTTILQFNNLAQWAVDCWRHRQTAEMDICIAHIRERNAGGG
eukprot:3762439-Heterocapsa_arctica.AAC.1